MKQYKGRDKSVDVARGIAMISVSFGHIMPALYDGIDLLCKYCFSFELSVFFLVSGYIQYGRMERNTMEFIKHNVVSLLYPYVIFSMLIFTFDSIRSFLMNGFAVVTEEFPVRISSALTWGVGACWFLPTFFLAGVIAFFCRKERRLSLGFKTAGLILIAAKLCATAEKYGYLKNVTAESICTASFWLWHLFNLFAISITGASLMLLGCVMKKYSAKLPEKLSGGGLYITCNIFADRLCCSHD